MKRKSNAEDDLESVLRPAKRQRHGSRIRLLDLSDELLLRTLSYLSTAVLTRCEQVCGKLRGLAKDNELWREKYYIQFVRHRARRLPSIRPMTLHEQESIALHYSSRAARWLDDYHLARAGSATNWKHAFKVKHNWTKGRAKTSEVEVGSRLLPAVLAKVYNGRLYTVDSMHGLRIWDSGMVRYSTALERGKSPSALDISFDNSIIRIAIGHSNGFVSVYAFDGSRISLLSQTRITDSPVTSVALTWPYLVAMSGSNAVAILIIRCQAQGDRLDMECLTNLHCDAELSPASLTIRKTTSKLIAGIVYAFNRFNTGWCLGLQEIRMDLTGAVINNRTTSSMSTPIRESFVEPKQPQFTLRSTSTSPFGLHPQLMRAPNSLSYSGCYILAGLPDNTLMVYTVISTDDKLEINVGRRLWGHTSAVSAAEVTSTGKAVSISAKSDEMRYWELEELLSSYSQSRTSTAIRSLSILNKAINERGDGLGLSLKEIKREADLVTRCVSFDDEQAIVVGERDQRQIISCFDFA